MLVEVKVPEVGESITEGILTQWHRREGDHVEVDEALYELETDKVTLDVPSDHEGSLHILVEAGSRVAVGQTVARIDTEVSRPAAEHAGPGKEREEAPAPQPAWRPISGLRGEPTVLRDRRQCGRRALGLQRNPGR